MQSLGSVCNIGSHPSDLIKPSKSGRKARRQSTNTKAAKKNNTSESREESGAQSFFSAFPKLPSTDGTQSFFAGLASFTQKQSAPRGRADPQTVFVAGASGRLGIRIVHELAAAGFKVRAGVRSQEKADSYQDLLADLAESIGPLDRAASSRINLVYCNLDEPETITPAIGPSSKVICAVGAAESEFTNFSAPRKIDFEGTERLINAAASLNIAQFVLVTSLATGKLGFPAGVLNLFGGVLIFKRKAEEALERSGMPYLIVRPGGMERPKDDHKDTHNVRLSTRDTLFGGTVSRLQIAELIVSAVASPEIAENKTLEVVAEKTAPSRTYEELLSFAPTEIYQEERVGVLEVEREIRAELDIATEELQASKEKLNALREQVAELQSTTAETRASAKQVQKEQSEILKQANKAENELNSLRAAAEQATLLSSAAKAVATESQRAQRENRVLSRQDIAAIRERVLNPPSEDADDEENENEVKSPAAMFSNFFGTVKEQQSVVVEEKTEEKKEVTKEEKKEVKKEAQSPLAAFSTLFSGVTKEKKIEEEAEGAVIDDDDEEEQQQQQEESSKVEDSPLKLLTGFLEGAKRGISPPAAAVPTSPPAAVSTMAPAPAPVAVPVVKKEDIAGKKGALVVKEQPPKEEEVEMKNIFAGITNFFQPQPAVYIDEIEQEEQKEEQQEEDEAAAARVEAAAAKQQQEEEERKKQEEEAAAAAAAKQQQEEEERKKQEEEERKKQEEEERKKQEEEAAAAVAAKQQQEEEEKKKQEEEAAAAAAATAEAAAVVSKKNAEEARNWISAWKERSASSSPSAVAIEVPPNVEEARTWISNWRSKN